jgi:hypothetical protein
MHEMYSPTPCVASHILEGTCAQVQNHRCIQQQPHRDKQHYLSDVLYLQRGVGSDSEVIRSITHHIDENLEG